MAAVAGAGLGGGLVSRGVRQPPHPAGRPVTAAEAGLLAGMRLRDYQDRYAGFRAVVGTAPDTVHIVGRVDWRRPLAYFASQGATPGPADGLVEAVPRLVAVRAGRPAGVGGDPSPPPGAATGPPPVPPDDGWQLRGLAPDDPSASAFDALINLLFALASPRQDPVRPAARFIRQDTVDGVAVSVLDAPPPGTSDAAEVRYWLDSGGGLRRVEALLAEDLPVRVDLQRSGPAAGQPAVPVIDLLGGAPVTPRPVTGAEAELLAGLASRAWSSGGGRISVELPVQPASLVRGEGWLDWRACRAALSLGNPDDDTQRSQVRADRYRVSTRGRTGDWRTVGWSSRPDGDLDALLASALAAAGARPGGAGQAGAPEADADTAAFLRRDELRGVPVTVFEIRAPGEHARPGEGRLRYWVDHTGLLRRLELRTGLGAFAHLDITPAPVPDLPRPG